MGTPAGFRFSGRALIIIAVTAFVISGIFVFVVPDAAHQIRVTAEDESDVSPDEVVLRYTNFSEGGKELVDEGLRADGYTRMTQSPPEFNYPDDTMDGTLVEKNGTIYAVATGMSGCAVCGFVNVLGYGVGIAGIVLLVRGVSRLVNGEADLRDDDR